MTLGSLWDFQLEAKYEVEKEQEARLWIEAVIGESLDEVILAVPLLMFLHYVFNAAFTRI